MRFAQHLEAVADAEYRQARLGRVDDRRHDRREAGDGAAAQIVTVGEAAWEHHAGHVMQGRVGMPQRDGLRTRQAQRPDRVAVVEAAGKRDHPDAHRHVSSLSTHGPYTALPQP
jgi:hypothetical protein